MLIKSIIANTIFDMSKRQNAFFWVGQLSVIVSTVIGVYLAASAGLKTAVDFHSITSDEQNFYSLSALREELHSNNELVLDFFEKRFHFNDKNEITSHTGGRFPELDQFVWKTMLRTTDTFELPIDILKKTSIYYSHYAENVRAYNNSGGKEKLFAAIRAYNIVVEMKETIIPRIDKQITVYRSRLEGFQVLGDY